MSDTAEQHAQHKLSALYRTFVLDGRMAPEWEPIFQRVPRAAFLPDLIWGHDTATGTDHSVDRTQDPDGWFRWVSGGGPLTIQWDDGAHVGPEPGRRFTSSCSDAGVVAAMLRDLDVRDAHCVLDIGTGSGWTAALLAERVGAANVTTIDVDCELAERARKSLHAAGYEPLVISGDGLAGWPAGAPYDRVHVTAAVRDIPFTWITQTRPGGVLVMPWGTRYAWHDAVLRLVVGDDGTATGRFTDPVSFMKLRAQRLVVPPHAEYVPYWPPSDARTSETRAFRDVFPVPGHDPFTFAIGLRVPDVTYAINHQDGVDQMWLYSLNDRSWAVSSAWADDTAHDQVSTVMQGGSRDLWDEVEAAYRWWVENGRPDVGRFGVTVGCQGTQLWLDGP